MIQKMVNMVKRLVCISIPDRSRFHKKTCHRKRQSRRGIPDNSNAGESGRGLIQGGPEPRARPRIIIRPEQSQTGKKAAGGVLRLKRKPADEYFAAEGRFAAIKLYGMEFE